MDGAEACGSFLNKGKRRHHQGSLGKAFEVVVRLATFWGHREDTVLVLLIV